MKNKETERPTNIVGPVRGHIPQPCRGLQCKKGMSLEILNHHCSHFTIYPASHPSEMLTPNPVVREAPGVANYLTGSREGHQSQVIPRAQ